MPNRPQSPRSFWSSKLGLAACASIAAMVTMVIATAHLDIGQAQAVLFTPPLADTIAIVGLA